MFLLSTVALRRTRGEAALIRQLQEEMTRREQMEETVRQAQHLEALGQLTGGVAHDFNNILTAIVGNLELITSHLAADDPKARLAAAAMSSAGRAARLVQHLLAFARRQRLQPQQVQLEPLIREAEPLFRRVLGETIAIDLGMPADLWPCRVDPAQFEAALLNLLLNARDAMPAGGRVLVAAQNRSVAADEIPDLPPGDYVVLSIEDSGAGMPAEVLARAFEPFYTTKEVGKGSGLGLSMVHGFAAQSGGTARIESAPGRGTTVHLYLPRAAAAPVPAAPPRPPVRAAAPAASAAMVLVVEDDDEVRQVTAHALETGGYHPVLAANAAEALRHLERQDVDVLVSDVVMPGGMSGVELARAARRLRHDLPVLLITGYASAQDLGAADDGVELLRKPFIPTHLCARLAALIARAAPSSA
jgi:nitrogen-specific signal transduction histidine kinase/CheY-like chemotaxis protein